MVRHALQCFLAVLITALAIADAEEAKVDPPAAEDAFNQLVTDLARGALPEEYVDAKHWGKTKEVWDGLKISREGFEIKTKRRKRVVKHGTWRRYEIEPVDPAQQFHIEVQNVRLLDDGRLGVEALCTANLHAHARLSQWARDVQLASISADAEARLRVRLALAVAFETERSGLLPEMIVKPQATAAELELVEFRLQRVSKLDGPLVKEAGDALRTTVEDRLQAKRHKLVEQVNKQIAKHPEKLRLSLADFAASRWKSLQAK